MPIRKPTPEERAEMIRHVRDYIITHGRGSFKRAMERVEIALAPALTPYQQRQAEKRAEWEEIDRELERERQAKADAAWTKHQRYILTLEIRQKVYKEDGITRGIMQGLQMPFEGTVIVPRAGLKETIRKTLWPLRSAQVSTYPFLVPAGLMRAAVDALIAWERRRLGMWSRRLEREGGRIKARQPRKALRTMEEVRRLSAEGHGATEIAKRVGISRRSVWRIVQAAVREEMMHEVQREEHQ